MTRNDLNAIFRDCERPHAKMDRVLADEPPEEVRCGGAGTRGEVNRE